MHMPVVVKVQIHQGAQPSWPNALGLFGRLIESVQREVAAQKAAHRLTALGDRMLEDIGMSESAAVAAAAKPWWRV